MRAGMRPCIISSLMGMGLNCFQNIISFSTYDARLLGTISNLKPMPLPTSVRTHLDPVSGRLTTLPKGVYVHHNRFIVKVTVKNHQYVLGTYADFADASAERDRAFYKFAPWLRRLPTDLVPEADLALLPPNPLLERALSELRSLDADSEREGRVAPVEVVPAQSTPATRETPDGLAEVVRALTRIAEAAERIADRLVEIRDK